MPSPANSALASWRSPRAVRWRARKRQRRLTRRAAFYPVVAEVSGRAPRWSPAASSVKAAGLRIAMSRRARRDDQVKGPTPLLVIVVLAFLALGRCGLALGRGLARLALGRRGCRGLAFRGCFACLALRRGSGSLALALRRGSGSLALGRRLRGLPLGRSGCGGLLGVAAGEFQQPLGHIGRQLVQIDLDDIAPGGLSLALAVVGEAGPRETQAGDQPRSANQPPTPR